MDGSDVSSAESIGVIPEGITVVPLMISGDALFVLWMVMINVSSAIHFPLYALPSDSVNVNMSSIVDFLCILSPPVY